MKDDARKAVIGILMFAIIERLIFIVSERVLYPHIGIEEDRKNTMIKFAQIIVISSVLVFLLSL